MISDSAALRNRAANDVLKNEGTVRDVYIEHPNGYYLFYIRYSIIHSCWQPSHKGADRGFVHVSCVPV